MIIYPKFWYLNSNYNNDHGTVDYFENGTKLKMSLYLSISKRIGIQVHVELPMLDSPDDTGSAPSRTNVNANWNEEQRLKMPTEATLMEH